MSRVTKDTVWPQLRNPVPQSVKDVIALYYELCDTRDPEAGPRQAREVFTPDALILGVSGTFQGSEAISKSRARTWIIFNRRDHYVTRVYSMDESGTDLMIMGTVDMDLTNGNHLDLPFAVRLLIDEETLKAGSPRIKLFQVFTDTAAVMRADGQLGPL